MASSNKNSCPSSNTDCLKWVPLKLSYVEYPKGDVFGHILGYFSLTPIILASAFVTLILFRRDLHTIFLFIGVFVNESINAVMKKLIAEPRPEGRFLADSDYGMPSAHSQFIWFLAAYIALFVFVRLHHMNNNTTLEYFWKAVIVIGSVTVAVLTSISRIYLMYHTWQQVLFGSLLGTIVGISWFALVHVVLTPYFPLIASWKISELMLIRDTTLIPNVLWFEYTNIRQESRARGRKLVSMKSQ